MANQFTHDKMCVIAEKMAETTGMSMTLSNSLDKYTMGVEANSDDAASASNNTNDNGSDREYIPQEYRFEALEGIVSSDSDFEDIIDRNIPVTRSKAFRTLAYIDAKGLRNPQRVLNVAKGMSRDLSAKSDVFCYQRMINEATMVKTSSSAFSSDLAVDAENLMLNYGLGKFDKKLYMSNTDYAKVAKTLGGNQYYSGGTVANALEKASIPGLATFDTMRSDYLLNLAGNTSTGLAINGDQSHTVATYDSSDEFYLDNRYMTLAVTGATSTTMPVGHKFTIAGVNYLHPETREDSGELLTFTVKTTGAGSIVISPAIVIAGPYRNASAVAADTAAVTILNIATSAPTLFYTPESTVIIPGRLPLPTDTPNVTSIEASTDQGLPMRMTYRYDFHKERYEIKGLIFFDCQVVYPNQLGIILSGQA